MNSSIARLVAAAAVVLTLVLAFVTYRVSRDYAAAPEAAAKAAAAQPVLPKILAVVALKPLAAYHAIGKDDVGLVEVSVAPADYFTSVAQVVGKEPVVDVDSGAPVTRRYFGEGNLLARAIAPGFQAVSVEINDVVAVGGFVRPGDTVDVLLYLRDAQGVSAAQARVLLRQVRVLAYEELLVERPEGLSGDARKDSSRSQTRRLHTAVLSVPEAQTTRLMLGASQGELRLALYGQKPGSESAPAADTDAVLVGGLPASPQTLAAIQATQVPDKAISMEELARIKPPPARQNGAAFQVPVYRAGSVETVAVKP